MRKGMLAVSCCAAVVVMLSGCGGSSSSNKPSMDDVSATAIANLGGEPTAVVAVLLAVENGYSLLQIVDGIQGNTLDASGTISGVSPQNSKQGVVARVWIPNASTIRKDELVALAGLILLDEILTLLENGYSLDQVIESLVLGWDTSLGEIEDEAGETICPDGEPEEVFRGHSWNRICPEDAPSQDDSSSDGDGSGSGDSDECIIGESGIVGIWSNPQVAIPGGGVLLGCTYNFTGDGRYTATCDGGVEISGGWDMLCNTIIIGQTTYTITSPTTMQATFAQHGGVTVVMTKH